ncbi:MAG: beta-ketoacyl-[acyl-carrier-protein] synthase family protein, partial [Bacteroidetes bacterium HGW-Bacteroidetes-23]
MNKRVAITGMGIISSIGNSVEENFQSLKNGKTGISTIENLETIHKEVIMVGEIKLSNQQLAQKLNLSEDNNFSRTTLLGAIAVNEAIQNAGINNINDCRSGFISATSVGGMDLNEKYFYEYFKDESTRRFLNSHDAGDSSHQIADYIGLKGMVTTVSTACSSAANAIMLGCRLIQSGQLDRVIVGGTDALAK